MMYLGQDPIGLATSIPIFGDKVEIEYGEYIAENDITTSNVTIHHNLGAIPDFVLIQTNNIEIKSYEKNYLLCCMVIKLSPTTSAIIARSITANSTNYGASNVVTTTSAASVFSNDSTVQFFGPGSSNYIKANVVYHYIIGKYKEVTPNA